eukprot:gnl/MRDRNA2_/MRDRNA2_89446_c0_seq1.p1 gnl/MRDRNA2_/MRDRNA2_89446_c0~~gnl/MRDRNA2_/MRDRNA2_89446_c0_seq1.p1  ORF type:complete len:167 (-),score=38.94 gnl/MRDRNA2_/MRDRNA2_89446_c0_seq1:146-646(-)
MVTDAVATYTQQALGHECTQAFMVLGCVFCGWCASGIMIRLLGSSGGKAQKGSAAFRNEVADFASTNSVEEAAEHWGLDKTEVLKCKNEALFWWCIEFVASSLWGTSKTGEHQKPEEQEENSHQEEYGLEQTSMDTKCSSNPGLALLEHYGVFGAAHGAWAAPSAE